MIELDTTQETSADWLARSATAPMPAGSVIAHVPSFAFQSPGGGENQFLETSRSLEGLGIPIRPFCPWIDRLGGARLIHLYGMSREGLELARVAKARGVPVVLSPICWYEPRAFIRLAPSRRSGLIDLGKLLVRTALPGLPGWRRALFDLADAILPNSRAEADQLVRLFAVDARKVRVVPNGVSDRFAGPTTTDGDFVLYTGRIEPRKNVLGLVRACRRQGMPLVVIGDVVPGHEGYGERCRREGHGSIRWVPRVDPDSPVLASAYATCRVFALPSWFETPGLSALEAALAGRAVVITPFGCTVEYFGERVEYARPDRVDEIAGALRRAWIDGPDPTLAGLVRQHFLWPEVARQTAEVYDHVAP